MDPELKDRLLERAFSLFPDQGFFLVERGVCDYWEDPLMALDLSIAKWKFIASQIIKLSKTRKDWKVDDGGIDTCGLCVHFFRRVEGVRVPSTEEPEDCPACPVQKKTRNFRCVGTPYVKFLDLFDENSTTPQELSNAALEEARFLEGLRQPKPEPALSPGLSPLDN